MPVIFNEPLSFLQRMVEYMEYAHLLRRAAEETDPVGRMQKQVVKAASLEKPLLRRVACDRSAHVAQLPVPPLPSVSIVHCSDIVKNMAEQVSGEVCVENDCVIEDLLRVPFNRRTYNEKVEIVKMERPTPELNLSMDVKEKRHELLNIYFRSRLREMILVHEFRESIPNLYGSLGTSLVYCLTLAFIYHRYREFMQKAEQQKTIMLQSHLLRLQRRRIEHKKPATDVHDFEKDLIRRKIRKFHDHGNSDYSSNGDVVYCQEKTVKCEKKFQLEQHSKTTAHLRSKQKDLQTYVNISCRRSGYKVDISVGSFDNVIAVAFDIELLQCGYTKTMQYVHMLPLSSVYTVPFRCFNHYIETPHLHTVMNKGRTYHNTASSC
ncbi:hypothetical protein ANN_17750 [Periplaneta americana]|uniref:Uncharacterized protein n=1 Tax=Periplaneta americana TaxID=6978 RepID=A0ABQ8STT7_PERAM|nr:hypothetical protein ANN_17750 [Periplaneta americana]